MHNLHTIHVPTAVATAINISSLPEGQNWQKKGEENGNFKTDTVPWRTGIVS